MSKDAPQPPAPPDPRLQINAETEANRFDVNSPFGNVRWTQGGSDGASPMSFEQWSAQLPKRTTGTGFMTQTVPPSYDEYQGYLTGFKAEHPGAGKWTQDVQLSPQERALYEGRSDIASALLDRSGEAIGKLPVGYSFKGAEDPTTNRFFMAQKKLLDKAFSEDEERLDQKLANQGLPMGSEAYRGDVDDLRTNRADALERASTNALGEGFRHDITERQQNYNEIAAALGGSQLQPVGQNGAPIDTGSAFANYQAGQNRQYQGNVAGYQADVAQSNTGMSAVATMIAAYI